MSLYTLLLLAIVILLFYIKKKITDLYEKVEKPIKTVKGIVSHPREAAEDLGAAVASTVFDEASKLINSKKKKRRR